MFDREFGVLIRQSRERLGLTPSRVAELIGRAPGTVRAWEKGTSTPADAAVVSTLAAVLGIDEVSLFEAAGLEPPLSEHPPSVRQALASITPSARRAEAAAEEGIDRADHPPVVATRPEQPTLPVEDGEPKPRSDPDRPLPGRAERRRTADAAPVLTPPVAPMPVPTPAEVATREPRHRAPATPRGLMERLRSATVRRPTPLAAPTTLPPAPRAPSYMEDPTERWSYRLRSVYTAVGVAALFIALGWAASNLLDALGAVWETLTSNL